MSAPTNENVCDHFYYWDDTGKTVRVREGQFLSSYDQWISSLVCCTEMIMKKKEEHQSESPMPLIGMYVAAASLVCSLAMAADVFHGFRHRKLWFPCKYFTLNAASLTLLAVAMKLPVDMSSKMPGFIDQLAKLASTTLMSTAMGNFLPSLGSMNDREIFMNIIALAILVITVFVNICIQLITQLIDPFFVIYHIVALSFMLLLLVISSFSALTVSTTKKCLQLNYDDKHKMILREKSNETQEFTTEKLKENFKKCWMMAETGSPQFVMARSVTCYASGTVCFLAFVNLAQAILKAHYNYNPGTHSLTMNGYIVSEGGPVGSAYKRSTSVVLVIQSIGVVVGTIAPAFRWFTAIKLRCPEKRVRSYKNELKTENYWIERLVGWREIPLALRVQSQKFRKLVQATKNLILNFFIGVQIMIVTTNKLVLLIPIFLMSTLMSFGRYYKVLKNNHTEPQSGPGTKLDLSPYVLYLEGEEELPMQIMKNNRDATNHFIQKGKKQQPIYLKELLDQSKTTFMGVAKFDSDQVPSLISEEPHNCWSLPVVTLTSIVIALPNLETKKVKGLVRSVSEGLFYANLVEEYLDAKGDLVNIRNAAKKVWSEVDFYRKWLDEDLLKIALEVKTSKETLEKLADMADIVVNKFKENMNGNQKENPLSWHIKPIAANSMHRISKTVLRCLEGCNNQTDEGLFNQLSVMIADILAACLTNLPRVITMECFSSTIEMREKSVQRAARLFGETEEILKILQRHELPSLNPGQASNNGTSSGSGKLASNNGTSSGSGKLEIAIE